MRPNGSGLRSFLLGLALVLAAAGTTLQPAAAQTTIDPSQRFGAIPSFAGSGLDGFYYYFPDNQIGSLAEAASLVAGASGPTVTFTTTNICFPDCDGNPFDTNSGGLTAFTNGNATNFNDLVPEGQVPTNSFFQSVLNISGYLAIPTAGSYTFSINSDDGSQLTIGSTTTNIDDGIHGQQVDSNTVSFDSPGLYAIALNYFQNGGGAGFDLTATDPNGICFLGCSNGNGGALANDLFYSQGQIDGAPAPEIGGGWQSIACLTILGSGVLVRRRYQPGRI